MGVREAASSICHNGQQLPFLLNVCRHLSLSTYHVSDIGVSVRLHWCLLRCDFPHCLGEKTVLDR